MSVNPPNWKLINACILLFLLGWVTQEWALFNIGKYSVILLYLAAIPFFRFITPRSATFVILPLLSTALAALVSLLRGGVNPMGVLSQGALQLLAILFAAGVASINWEDHLPWFTKAMIVISAPIVAFGGYQMIARAKHLKYAFLPVTNQQAYAVGDLQRGWEKDHFTRASAVFVEPSELGYYCLWLLTLGLCVAKGRWRFFCLGLAFCGMLFSQSLSGALGVGVLIITYLAINPVNFRVIRQVGVVVLLSVMIVLAIIPLMPEAFDAFYKRIEQAVTLDNRADSGRVDHLPANWKAFKEAPLWGEGLASISSAEDNGTDVTTFTYFLMLIERGLVGGGAIYDAVVLAGLEVQEPADTVTAEYLRPVFVPELVCLLYFIHGILSALLAVFGGLRFLCSAQLFAVVQSGVYRLELLSGYELARLTAAHRLPTVSSSVSLAKGFSRKA